MLNQSPCEFPPENRWTRVPKTGVENDPAKNGEKKEKDNSLLKYKHFLNIIFYSVCKI